MTQTHIYDNVFRSMEEHAPSVMIPLINEVFGTNYAADEPVTRLGDKQHVLDMALETDACLKIQQKLYHCECESNPDNSIIAIRMFQYDLAVALEHKHRENGVYVITFPHSTVLYLRHGKNTKNTETVIVRMPDGREIDYIIPIVKCQEYTKDDIFNKKLYVMLPYYILRYEKYLAQYEEKEEKRQLLIEEYQDICQRLENSLARENREAYAEIHKLIMQVLDYVLNIYTETKKGVSHVMGGKAMESYKSQLLREGQSTLLSSLIEKKLKANKSIEQIASEVEMSVEEIQPLYDSIKKQLEAE